MAQACDTGHWLGLSGGRYALAADYLLHEPIEQTWLHPCFEPGDCPERPLVPDTRHPPGFTWLTALAFACFGESEGAARTAPLLATLLLAGLLFAMAARSGDRIAGASAAAVFLLLPMTQVYGLHVDMQGAPTAAWIAASVLAAALWVERRCRLAPPALMVAIVAGMLLDWPAWFAAALLIVALLRRGERWLARSVVIAALPIAIAIAGLQLSVDGGRSMVEAVKERVVGLEAWGPTVDGWLAGGAEFARRFHVLLPIGVWLAAAVVLALARRDAGRMQPVIAAATVARFPAGPLLAVVGALHVLLFPIGAIVHEYWAYLLAAPLALLCGFAVERAGIAWSRWRPAHVLLLVALVGIAASRGPPAGSPRWNVRRDPLHRVLALGLRTATPPAARVLTNGPYNPPWKVDERPDFSWYADRDIRGAITTLAAFESARARRPATHFLALPPPAPPLDPDLAAWLALHARPGPLDRRRLSLWELPER